MPRHDLEGYENEISELREENFLFTNGKFTGVGNSERFYYWHQV